MNCQDVEKDIYLYSELSLTEKANVDDHVRSCLACRQLFQEVREMQDTIDRISQDKMVPANASKLTSVIMSRINTPVGPLHRELMSLFNLRYVKVSFALVSASLLCLFVFESIRDFAEPKEDIQANAKGGVILSVRDFRKQASVRKEGVQLFADCRSPFRSQQYFLDCARNSMIKRIN